MARWNRMAMLGLGAAVLLVACGFWVAQTATAETGEKEISLNEVPAKAKAAILKAAGDHKIQEVEAITLKLYEAEWTRGKKEIEILFTHSIQLKIKLNLAT